MRELSKALNVKMNINSHFRTGEKYKKLIQPRPRTYHPLNVGLKVFIFSIFCIVGVGGWYISEYTLRCSKKNFPYGLRPSGKMFFFSPDFDF